mmetsp:Transcript_18/g.36  ORF Transcript_18/g.36 Transcript_18/m.36 type:complete len:750 (+) Transcript_18:51-2300(+)
MLRSRAVSSVQLVETGLTKLFKTIDENGDGVLTQEEFVNGILNIRYLDVSAVEAARLYESLDTECTGSITLRCLYKSSLRWRWLRRVVKVFLACQECSFQIPDDYDYSKPTCENYKGNPGEFVGDFVKIREERDYTYHNNYTPCRQLWQDMAVKSCLGKTEAQSRPWVVYTCGPMGVGKGHVLSWLSEQGLFPLEFIVHVDPDFFKRIMPEWTNYLSHAASAEVSSEKHGEQIAAGSACHLESAFLQEITMEAAMSERQNVWVDGSLSDGAWFSKEFDDIRNRFPHYRIAIIYITASEETVRARIAKRSAETGRSIPESQIVRSLQSPEASIRLLAPKTDLVVRITNESAITLTSVEDYSGNWYRGLQKHFGVISKQHPDFPFWLGPLYFENTSLVGRPFIEIPSPYTLTCDENEEILTGVLDKEGNMMQSWKSVYFVLTRGKLSYYSKGDKQLKGVYIISKESTVSCMNQPRDNSSPSANSFLGGRSSGVFSFARSATNAFNLTGIKADGSRYSVNINAAVPEEKTKWISALEAQINLAKKKELIELGYYDKSHDLLKLTDEATYNSPDLRIVNKSIPDFAITASKLCAIGLEKAERDIAGFPRDATHFRWLFPVQGFDPDDLEDDIMSSDPDIALIINGGTVCYDKTGKVLAVRSLSEQQTQHMMTFSAPEPLKPEDCDRLHAGERWIPIQHSDWRKVGAKYQAYILPLEELPSRRFPPSGAHAFLFREPSDPPDPRDRYFSPVLEY